jgi:hypothetical protein
LPEEEHQQLIEKRCQRIVQLHDDERLLLHQQEQERPRNRNDTSANAPVIFVPQNNRELRFNYYGTPVFPNRMDTNFSECVSLLFSMGNTDNMDASIPDKMKYYYIGTFYHDAHHMDHPVNRCPYCNELLFKGEKSSV